MMIYQVMQRGFAQDEGATQAIIKDWQASIEQKQDKFKKHIEDRLEASSAPSMDSKLELLSPENHKRQIDGLPLFSYFMGSRAHMNNKKLIGGGVEASLEVREFGPIQLHCHS